MKKKSERRDLRYSLQRLGLAGAGPWVLAGFFAIGFAVAAHGYARVLSRLAGDRTLVVVVSALPAGGTGTVAAMVKGGGLGPGAIARATLSVPAAAAAAAAASPLSPGGIAVVALPLADVPPGPAILTVEVEDLVVREAVVIAGTDRLALWATTTVEGARVKVGGLLCVRSGVSDRPLAGRRARFRLVGPSGDPLACEDAATDDHGVARFACDLGEPPAGAYRLLAAHGEASVAAELELGRRIPGGAVASAAPPRAPPRLVPEAGALIAGWANRCRIEGGEDRAFPLDVTVGAPATIVRFATRDAPVTIEPPPLATTVPVVLRSSAGGTTPPASLAHDTLSVRARPAIIPRPARRSVAPGDALAVDLVATDPDVREFVLEVLAGAAPIATVAGSLTEGRGEVVVAIPPNLSGSLFLRVWPVRDDAEAHATWTTVALADASSGNIVAIENEDGGTVLHNRDTATPVACYVLGGDGGPRSAETTPLTLAGVPFAARFAARDPALVAAPRHLRFWAGCLLFLASLPLLRGFALLLPPARRLSLGAFLGVSLLLYATTTANFPLFGTAVMAVSLFWIHRCYRTTFRLLPPIGRLSFRWAVPVLCLAPYFHLARPDNGFSGSAARALQRLPDAETGAGPATPAMPPIALEPGGRHALRPSGDQEWAVLLASTPGRLLEAAAFQLAGRGRLDVRFDAPESMIAGDRADVIHVPLELANRGNEPWKGSVRIEGRTGLVCRAAGLPGQVTLQPHDALTTEVTLEAGTPGAGSAVIAWSGSTSGTWQATIDLLPAGETRRMAWNGVSTGGAPKVFEAHLPRNALYRATELKARIFPGPLSHLGAIMTAARRAPWPDPERAAASAHAACLYLTYLVLTGQTTDGEAAVRSTLGTSLLSLLRWQSPDGSFGSPGDASRLIQTACALLVLDDLERLWSPPVNAAERARDYLRTQVRADGSFRTDELRAPLSPPDILATCLVACALEDRAPASTRRLLASTFESAREPVLRAAVLAALRLTGTFEEEAVLAAVTAIEGFDNAGGESPESALAWWAYGLAASGARPERAQHALALLAMRKGSTGALATLADNQFFGRSLILCTRRGPRLTENVFRFVVNEHPRETRGVDRTVPDVPGEVDLTEGLHMEQNILRIESSGSALTPYQVLFSYAVPWQEAIGPSQPPLAVGAAFPEGPLRVGVRTDCTVTVENATNKDIAGAQILFRLPPLVALAEAPRGLDLLAGAGRPGEQLLFRLPVAQAKTTSRFALPVVPVAAGTAYVSPPEVLIEDSPAPAVTSPAGRIVVR